MKQQVTTGFMCDLLFVSHSADHLFILVVIQSVCVVFHLSRMLVSVIKCARISQINITK